MPTYAFRAVLLAALPALLASCSSPRSGAGVSAGNGGRGAGRGAGGPVPVVTAQAEQKAVPVTVPAVGTVEAVSTVEIRSQITAQLTAIHFVEGREVRRGSRCSASIPGRSRRRCSRRRPSSRADTASLQNAQAAAGAGRHAVPARPACARSVRQPARQHGGARGDRRGRQGRHRDGAPERPVHRDRLADHGPDGFARRARGRPDPRERHQSARGHQPAGAGLRDVLRSRALPRGHPALPGAETAFGQRGLAAGPGPCERAGAGRRRRGGDACAGRGQLHRQHRGFDDRDDPAEGDVPERRSPALAWRVRPGDARPDDAAGCHRRAGHRRADVAGRVSSCTSSRPTARSRCGRSGSIGRSATRR